MTIEIMCVPPSASSSNSDNKNSSNGSFSDQPSRFIDTRSTMANGRMDKNGSISSLRHHSILLPIDTSVPPPNFSIPPPPLMPVKNSPPVGKYQSQTSGGTAYSSSPMLSSNVFPSFPVDPVNVRSMNRNDHLKSTSSIVSTTAVSCAKNL